MATIITSDQTIPIDESFKVSAGPGAGKTYWLVNHIKNVLAHSSKLKTVKKIACITYTNVGTDTISTRLPYNNDCVEVITIHSFLFANVIKPYVYLIAKGIGLQYETMSVIDDTNYISIRLANSLLIESQQKWIDAESFYYGLKDSFWHYNNKYDEYKPKRPQLNSKTNYYISNSAYMHFKKYMWKRGLINYDDILYLSWYILYKYPQIYTLLRAKYPYIFVDEFQDTIPFVVDFLQSMGNIGTIIGVVGDKAQAIFEFIGATPKQFDNFIVPNMHEYAIQDNRRSSQKIIDFLNVIRTDFPQNNLNGVKGQKPILIVGDKLDCYQEAVKICQTDNVKTLAYKNIISNAMKIKNGTNISTNFIDDDFDSNTDRQCIIKSLIKAVEYAMFNDIRNAWRQLDTIDPDRSKSIIWLRLLLNGYENYKNGTIMDFYNYVSNVLKINMSSFRAGESKTFYMTHKYIDMAMGVKNIDANITHKTIHKSKGEEFDNVFVILNEEKELDFILNPDLNNKVSHRVYYVGCSRAKNRLFINVPTLSSINYNRISTLPIEIVYL